MNEIDRAAIPASITESHLGGVHDVMQREGKRGTVGISMELMGANGLSLPEARGALSRGGGLVEGQEPSQVVTTT